MNEGLIPSRYAKALFEYAGDNHDDKRVYDMMHTLAGSFAAEPSMQQVMANP
ncbi:MAG: F0F1 ATP synthase subunit delta, partial [Duncaniella sp.]|nr:F0F1 ATP synthase subunit delta [Duncaniella sp.]